MDLRTMAAIFGQALTYSLIALKAFAIGAHCGELHADLLTPIERAFEGSTGGTWLRDEKNGAWLLKKDGLHRDLQSSAEVISSKIYRHMGYQTPETVKVIMDSETFAAVRDVGQEFEVTDFYEINTSKMRQIRVIAAYLKDWDRLVERNNLKMKDGSVFLVDFGGSLGAKARGDHKPGEPFSQAIGVFEDTKDIAVIYDSFEVDASLHHPWKYLTREDIRAVVRKFRSLTDKDITDIVKSAKYSSPSDEAYMIRALRSRRDGIVSNASSLEDLVEAWAESSREWAKLSMDMQARITQTQLTRKTESLIGLHSFGDSRFYIDRYFYNMRVNTSSHPKKKPTLRELITLQPWFEYDARGNLIFHAEGTQENLIYSRSNGQTQITLYRGTSKAELESLLKIAEGKEGAVKTFEQAFYRRGENSALFFTSGESVGRNWERQTTSYSGDGVMYSLTLSVEELLSLSRQKKIYVGVENEQLEIAFLDPKTMATLSSRIR